METKSQIPGPEFLNAPTRAARACAPPKGEPMRTSRFDTNIENLKRRGALPPFSLFEGDPRVLLDRLLNVKKIRDIIFAPKVRAKSR